MTCHKKPMCADQYECASCRTNGHTSTCDVWASNGADCTCGAWARQERHHRAGHRINLWEIRTTSSGSFADDGRDPLWGARREDSWSFWDAFDSLHRYLLVLLGIAATGLVLHAFGVFCR